MTGAITLSTRTKIAIARQLHRIVMAPRRLTGSGPELFAKRNGILWHLDLREGIDLSIYLFGAFEWSTVSTYRRIVRPGDTVLDIGANRGAHTLPLARSVGPGGRVIAFEPTDAAAARLSENIALNPALGSRVAVRRSLLVDGPGAPGKPAQFPNGQIYASWPVDGRSARADAHPLHCGIPASTDGARLETLDDAWAELGFPPVSFIKLDVDGNEPAVLRGASRLLAELRPTILLELAPYGSTERGERADATESELHNAGSPALQSPRTGACAERGLGVAFGSQRQRHCAPSLKRPSAPCPLGRPAARLYSRPSRSS